LELEMKNLCPREVFNKISISIVTERYKVTLTVALKGLKHER